MLRAIREIQPRWVVGENVLGLVNWSGGLVFHEVQADLEATGYEVFPYVLPACAVNAPHRRDRVWFVGYSDKWGRQKHKLSTGGQMSEDNINRSKATSNPDSYGISRQPTYPRASHKIRQRAEGVEKVGDDGDIRGWDSFPIEPPICTGNDGLSSRLDNITFPKWRNESIKAAGNAIVPQVAFQIFQAINQYESQCPPSATSSPPKASPA
jgi:DNA (cytosine-5)-methyltransferase 1